MLRVASLLLLLGCARDRSDAADTAAPASANAEALARDSAAGDSLALATIPERLRPDFDIQPQVTLDALSDSVSAFCQPLSDPDDAEVRKRLRGEWPRGHLTVLFVRADRSTGALHRVELVRRPPQGTQRGYIWDGDSDKTTAVEWTAGRRDPTTYTLPEGTPAPRALRALGRRLLVLPCSGRRPGAP
jgi:hypothetical protein